MRIKEVMDGAVPSSPSLRFGICYLATMNVDRHTASG
jgi:hypothetical protein